MVGNFCRGRCLLQQARLLELSLELGDHHRDDLLDIDLDVHGPGELLLLDLEDSVESLVLLDDLAEDQDRHLLLERRRDHLQELLQLVLLRLCALSEDQELSHSVLENSGEVHLLHGGVRDIDLLLELSLLPSAHLSQHGHVSEQPRVEDGHAY